MKDLCNFYIFDQSSNENAISELKNFVDTTSDLNIIDDEGSNLLSKIIYFNSYKYEDEIINIIDHFIKNGLDKNHQNWHGCSTLHWAIYNRPISLIKLLLENGVNPNLIDYEEHGSVLDFVLSEYYMSDDKSDEEKLVEIIKLLIKYNAKPRRMLFTKQVDTYLYIDSFRTYPTGLLTKYGNIYVDDIPGVTKDKRDEFMYWLLNERPSESVFKNPGHPILKKYANRLEYWVKYFEQLLKGEIIVGSDDPIKISAKIFENLKNSHFPNKY